MSVKNSNSAAQADRRRVLFYTEKQASKNSESISSEKESSTVSYPSTKGVDLDDLIFGDPGAKTVSDK